MGKMALAAYRARKARDVSVVVSATGGRRRVLPEACERVFRDERTVTRVIAALMHNVSITTISHDLRIPRRAVAIISQRERQL